SQSFNVVNTLRVLGRWMRMVTIPNQSSVAKAWQEFDDNGRMKPSSYYDRVVDVMEELMKFTLLVRGRSDYLVDRYSERRGAEEARRVSAAASVAEYVQNQSLPGVHLAGDRFHFIWWRRPTGCLYQACNRRGESSKGHSTLRSS